MNTVCLEGIPPGSQVGLNLHTWQSGPNFRGIRLVPDGLYCLHIQIQSVATTKYAAWLDLRYHQHGKVAYKWDTGTESIVQIGTEHVESISDLFLSEYPRQDNDRDWSAVSRYLTPAIIQSIVPLNQVLTSTVSSNVESLASDMTDLNRTTNASSTLVAEDEGDVVRFSFQRIDLKRSWRPGAIGREVTEMALDKSWLLKYTLRRAGGKSLKMEQSLVIVFGTLIEVDLLTTLGTHAVLGEFSFCFLSVLMYTAITAFDQWNTVLALVSNSKQAILESPAFFRSFLDLLHEQMKQVPSDLYADIFSLTIPRHMNMIQKNLNEVKFTASNTTDLAQELGRLEESLTVLMDFLQREFGVDEDHVQQQAIYPVDDRDDESEDDEDKPVVVDL